MTIWSIELYGIYGFLSQNEKRKRSELRKIGYNNLIWENREGKGIKKIDKN